MNNLATFQSLFDDIKKTGWHLVTKNCDGVFRNTSSSTVALAETISFVDARGQTNTHNTTYIVLTAFFQCEKCGEIKQLCGKL